MDFLTFAAEHSVHRLLQICTCVLVDQYSTWWQAALSLSQAQDLRCWLTHMHARVCRLNAAVFGGRLPADLHISWNVHLKTTAGLTHYSRTSLVGQAPR